MLDLTSIHVQVIYEKNAILVAKCNDDTADLSCPGTPYKP